MPQFLGRHRSQSVRGPPGLASVITNGDSFESATGVNKTGLSKKPLSANNHGSVVNSPSMLSTSSKSFMRSPRFQSFRKKLTGKSPKGYQMTPDGVEEDFSTSTEVSADSPDHDAKNSPNEPSENDHVVAPTKSPRKLWLSPKKKTKDGNFSSAPAVTPRSGKSFLKGKFGRMRSKILHSSGASVVTSAMAPKTPRGGDLHVGSEDHLKPTMRRKLKKTSPERLEEWIGKVKEAIDNADPAAVDYVFTRSGSGAYTDEEHSLIQDRSLVFYGADDRRVVMSDDISMSSVELLYHWITCSMDNLPERRVIHPRGMVIYASTQEDDDDDDDMHEL